MNACYQFLPEFWLEFLDSVSDKESSSIDMLIQFQILKKKEEKKYYGKNILAKFVSSIYFIFEY